MDPIVKKFHLYCGFYDEPKMVQDLLSKYPHLVDSKMNGSCVLHKAVIYGNIEVTRLLLGYGADPTLCSFGQTALDIARQRNRHEIINVLYENNRAYLVYKGFVIYGGENKTLVKRSSEIKFSEDENHIMVKEVLHSVWAKSNYDIFGELMSYLI